MLIQPQTPCAQRGVATLLVTLFVLLLVTVMVLYTSGVGVMDLRMAGNEYRYKMAHANAEAGLEAELDLWHNQASAADQCDDDANDASAATRGAADFSSSCASTAPSGTPTPTQYQRVIRKLNENDSVNDQCVVTRAGNALFPSDPGIYVGIVCARGAFDGGVATVSREFTLSAISLGPPGGPDAPIIAGGAVGAGGNYNVVANSNGGGAGVPVAVWSTGNAEVDYPGNTAGLQGVGSYETCHIGDFDGSDCGGNISSAGNPPTVGGDIVDEAVTPSNGGTFPDDVFDYTFGVPASEWEVVRSKATVITAAECANLSPTSGTTWDGHSVNGLYWIEGGGTCDLPNNAKVGNCDPNGDGSTADADPVILVLDETNATQQGSGGSMVCGIIFLFDKNGNGTAGTFTSNGTAGLRGSLITNGGLPSATTNLNGTYNIIYDTNVFANLSPSGAVPPPNEVDIAFIPGSWKDF